MVIVGRLGGLGRDPGPRIDAQLAADDTDFDAGAPPPAERAARRRGQARRLRQVVGGAIFHFRPSTP